MPKWPNLAIYMAYPGSSVLRKTKYKKPWWLLRACTYTYIENCGHGGLCCLVLYSTLDANPNMHTSNCVLILKPVVGSVIKKNWICYEYEQNQENPGLSFFLFAFCFLN
jgi:hypothetical protein